MNHLRKTPICLLLLVLVGPWLSVGTAQAPVDALTGGLSVREFKYRGDRYLLTGRQATTTVSRVHIRNAQAHIDQEGEAIHIASDNFYFDRKTQRGSSDDKVHVRSAKFTMEGVGCDVDFANGHVRFRSQVKIRVYESAAAMLAPGASGQ